MEISEEEEKEERPLKKSLSYFDTISKDFLEKSEVVANKISSELVKTRIASLESELEIIQLNYKALLKSDHLMKKANVEYTKAKKSQKDKCLKILEDARNRNKTEFLDFTVKLERVQKFEQNAWASLLKELIEKLLTDSKHKIDTDQEEEDVHISAESSKISRLHSLTDIDENPKLEESKSKNSKRRLFTFSNKKKDKISRENTSNKTLIKVNSSAYINSEGASNGVDSIKSNNVQSKDQSIADESNHTKNLKNDDKKRFSYSEKNKSEKQKEAISASKPNQEITASKSNVDDEPRYDFQLTTKENTDFISKYNTMRAINENNKKMFLGPSPSELNLLKFSHENKSGSLSSEEIGNEKLEDNSCEKSIESNKYEKFIEFSQTDANLHNSKAENKERNSNTSPEDKASKFQNIDRSSFNAKIKNEMTEEEEIAMTEASHSNYSQFYLVIYFNYDSKSKEKVTIYNHQREENETEEDNKLYFDIGQTVIYDQNSAVNGWVFGKIVNGTENQ
ncbi:MAG: hypothetical protein MHPSP_002329 [Paramarteilia canceri]